MDVHVPGHGASASYNLPVYPLDELHQSPRASIDCKRTPNHLYLVSIVRNLLKFDIDGTWTPIAPHPP
jgi:hypothetical protein